MMLSKLLLKMMMLMVMAKASIVQEGNVLRISTIPCAFGTTTHQHHKRTRMLLSLMSLDSDSKTKNSHCHSGWHLLRVYTSKMFHPIGPTEPTIKWLEQVVLVWFCWINFHYSNASKTLTKQPPENAVAFHVFWLSENGLDVKIPGFAYFSRLYHCELIGWHSDCS